MLLRYLPTIHLACPDEPRVVFGNFSMILYPNVTNFEMKVLMLSCSKKLPPRIFPPCGGTVGRTLAYMVSSPVAGTLCPYLDTWAEEFHNLCIICDICGLVPHQLFSRTLWFSPTAIRQMVKWLRYWIRKGSRYHWYQDFTVSSLNFKINHHILFLCLFESAAIKIE